MPEHGVELDWDPVNGAAVYRVLVRDGHSGTYCLKERVSSPPYLLSTEGLDPHRPYHWHIQARKARLAAWSDVTPPVRLPLDPPEGTPVTELRWPDSGAAAYRIVVRDETVGEIAVKDGVKGTRYLVRWDELDPAHQFRYRVQEWREGRWQTDAKYAPLHPPLSLIRSVSSRDPSSSSAGGDVLFLFTVDTEVNLRYMPRPSKERGIEQQIFCRHESGEYGVGYMMDLLDGYGFKGTFFLDILAEYQFGEGSLDPVVEAIRGRGHDVQLHLHSAPHLRYASSEEIRSLSGALRSNDAELFRRALALAVELFEKRVGQRAVAYRSGGYNLTDEFFPVLEEFDIAIDSSLFPFKNCRTSPWTWARTQPFKFGNVLEIPVTWMVDRRPGGSVPQQFNARRQDNGQQSALSRMEGTTGTVTTLVYLAHSYSLLSREAPADPEHARRTWNDDLRAFCPPEAFSAMYAGEESSLFFFGGPDLDRISLLERALAEVAGRGDVQGASLADVHRTHLDTWNSAPSLPVEPVPVWHPAARQAQLSGARRYSSSYLGYLEDIASANETGGSAAGRR